jgi:hypothetical protein
MQELGFCITRLPFLLSLLLRRLRVGWTAWSCGGAIGVFLVLARTLFRFVPFIGYLSDVVTKEPGFSHKIIDHDLPIPLGMVVCYY